MTHRLFFMTHGVCSFWQRFTSKSIVLLDVADMCRKMARTGNSSSDSESDSEVASRWRRPPPSDDECDDALMLKSHQLRSLQRDSNIVLNIRVMTALAKQLGSFSSAIALIIFGVLIPKRKHFGSWGIK